MLCGQCLACAQAGCAHDLASARAHATLVLRQGLGTRCWGGGLPIAVGLRRVEALLLLPAVRHQAAVAAGRQLAKSCCMLDPSAHTGATCQVTRPTTVRAPPPLLQLHSHPQASHAAGTAILKHQNAAGSGGGDTQPPREDSGRSTTTTCLAWLVGHLMYRCSTKARLACLHELQECRADGQIQQHAFVLR